MTEQEFEAHIQAFAECNIEGETAAQDRLLFRAGFVAGLEYSAESLDCLRLVQQLAGGQDWREWLERAAEVMKDN